MSETTADGTHGHNFGDADPSQKTNSPQDTESWQQELPSFMRNFERFDWILWGLLAASGIYGLHCCHSARCCWWITPFYIPH